MMRSGERNIPICALWSIVLVLLLSGSGASFGVGTVLSGERDVRHDGRSGASSGVRTIAEVGDTDRIRRVETGLLTHNVVPGEASLTLEDRMRFYRVAGVSVAVVDDGRIAWARAWGEVAAGSGTAVDTTTLFQAASISKPVAAAGVLRLVEDGVLDLDSDVNRTLRSWRIPEDRFTSIEKVTLRRLLSHSAGTTVHGYPGYAVNSPLPTLLELLDGVSPSNTEAVRVDAVPGSLWRYSGGGTSIAQLLMSDATDVPFVELMEKLVLVPAGMIHSTFAQPLPEERRSEAATAHRFDGTPIEGGHRIYPEAAAAGLWSTPSDLARFLLEIQRAYTGISERLLATTTARLMLAREAGDHGLGFFLSGEGSEHWFEHAGSNAGFQSFFAMLAEQGRGAVIMTNGDGGADLAMEIMRSIAREYGFPRFHPNVREAVDLDVRVLADFGGDYYAVGSGAPAAPIVRVRLEGDVLRSDVPLARWHGRTLRAASESTFFFLENPGDLAFERDDSGQVVGALLSGLGEAIRLVRR